MSIALQLDRVAKWMREHPAEIEHIIGIDITSGGTCAINIEYDAMSRLFAGRESHCTTVLGYEHLTCREDGIDFRAMRPASLERYTVTL